MAPESTRHRLARVADELSIRGEEAQSCMREIAQEWHHLKPEHQEAVIAVLEAVEYRLEQATGAYHGLRELLNMIREAAD